LKLADYRLQPVSNSKPKLFILKYLRFFSSKIFEANNDSSSVVKYHIFPRIFARYVRLHPKTWQGACAVRTEVYGCYEGIVNDVRAVAIGGVCDV
jgi:hypothetical protein